MTTSDGEKILGRGFIEFEPKFAVKVKRVEREVQPAVAVTTNAPANPPVFSQPHLPAAVALWTDDLVR